MNKFVLGSKSPRRIELFDKYISHDFIHVDSFFDERQANLKAKYPFNYVKLLSYYKGLNVVKNYKESIVITSDTIVYFKGEILNKPKDYEDAFRMLKELSNNTHKVYTGYSIFINGKFIKSDYEISYVTFNKLLDEHIKKYILEKSPYDKAGSYGIQEDDQKYHLIKKYKGSFFNIMGLPIEKLKKDLKDLNLI